MKLTTYNLRLNTSKAYDAVLDIGAYFYIIRRITTCPLTRQNNN